MRTAVLLLVALAASAAAQSLHVLRAPNETVAREIATSIGARFERALRDIPEHFLLDLPPEANGHPDLTPVRAPQYRNVRAVGPALDAFESLRAYLADRTDHAGATALADLFGPYADRCAGDAECFVHAVGPALVNATCHDAECAHWLAGALAAYATHAGEVLDGTWQRGVAPVGLMARPVAMRDLVPDDGADPLEARQWTHDALSVAGAWARGATGEGVVINFVDTGLYAHRDTAPNVRGDLAWNAIRHNDDVRPASSGHGTAAASVACGAREGTCGVGVAPRCSVAPTLLLISGPISDVQEGEAFASHRADVDIVSCSFGPPDDGVTLGEIGAIAQMALARAFAEGRGGLGTVVVFAGGNGNENSDNVVLDRYASQPAHVAVAALGQDGTPAYYSERGTPLMVAAPSSSRQSGVVAAQGGYSDHDCTTTFGGTSAAAPAIAGVVALMLHKRPGLTVLDVHDILIESARTNRPTTGVTWLRNAAGVMHSTQVGFGVPNADTCVALAETRAYHYRPTNFSVEVPLDGTAFGLGSWSASVDVPERLDVTLFAVELTLTMDVGFCGMFTQRNLAVRSPAGTLSVVLPETRLPVHGLDGFALMTRQFHRERLRGTWEVRGENYCSGPANVRRATLTFYGATTAAQ